MATTASFAVVTLCVLAVLTPAITYTTAVLKGHVDPFVPHVATTGDLPPESTIFTELVVVTTCFVLLVVHVRFVYVSEYCARYGVEEIYRRANVAALFVGYVACAGLLILGCFQQSNALYLHAVASCFLFTGGSFVYVTLQTVLSFRLRYHVGNSRDVYIRIALNAFMFTLACAYLLGLALTRWKCTTAQGSKAPWCRDGLGWKYHVASALSEWVLLLAYVGYIVTYYNEFRMVTLTTVKIRVTFLPSPSASEEDT